MGEDGNAYEGRGWDTQGAHTRGYNSVGLGIDVLYFTAYGLYFGSHGLQFSSCELKFMINEVYLTPYE